MENEGTVTHIETDDERRFKMCFLAFGFAIHSFLTNMRPLLITDGAHLKGTYKGSNLVLVGMDGNNQIIPIATCVSQGETKESWTWFLLKLKECIGEVPNLAIITDRHPTIILACNTIFSNAFHGPEAYKKLEETGFETWSRALCPAKRYNYMTSTCAESINNLTRHVRKAPIMQLMEWYRALLQKWKTTLYYTYQELVYPVGEPLTWQCPDGLQEYEATYTNNYVRSQEYEEAYISNNYVRLQEYEAAYISNNYVRSQEYEAAYTNNYVRSQEYQATYNSMGSQEYEATYNSMDERSQDPNPTMPNLFSQFNLGQSPQQTYFTWDSTWDHVNLADP
nr:transposase, MuDR, MULE transposase domain protein [Tanacetum cinerariifolium]